MQEKEAIEKEFEKLKAHFQNYTHGSASGPPMSIPKRIPKWKVLLFIAWYKIRSIVLSIFQSK